jgi:hypothetical protein
MATVHSSFRDNDEDQQMNKYGRIVLFFEREKQTFAVIEQYQEVLQATDDQLDQDHTMPLHPRIRLVRRVDFNNNPLPLVVIPTSYFIRPFAIVPAVKKVTEKQLLDYNQSITNERRNETKAMKETIKKMDQAKQDLYQINDEMDHKLVREDNPPLNKETHPAFQTDLFIVLPVV